MPLNNEKQGEALMMLSNLSNKVKELQEQLQTIQKLQQRLSVIASPQPKDMWDEEMLSTEIDKHFARAKTEFAKLFPDTAK